MSGQYLRQCKLTVETYGPGPDNLLAVWPIDANALHVRFATQHDVVQTPGHADIRIYNLSDVTANRLRDSVTVVGGSKRYVIVIECGYQGSAAATVFRGEIIQVRRGRESPVDTFIEILARDGDTGYTQAVINETLAAGWRPMDAIQVLAKAMSPYGVQLPAMIPSVLLGRESARATTLHGMARDIMWQFANAYGFTWSIQGGRLQILMRGDSLPGKPIILNSENGMVGLPVQTYGGIVVRCLIRPEIKPGVQIQIDQASVQMARISPDITAGAENEFLKLSVAADGIYNVLAIDTVGDTRGQEWYQTLICIVPGRQLPATLGIIPR